MAKSFDKLRHLLLNPRRKEEWPWLTDIPGRPGLKRANKFFAAAIVDYQMNADFVWDRIEQRIEIEMRDPQNLWRKITSIPRARWSGAWKTRPWHKFPAGHFRVWRIGRDIMEHYDGDVRRIWRNQTPSEVYRRLMKMRVGPQISRMIIGALLDAREIRGKSDVKADIHVKRVLGRLTKGRDLTVSEATEITRQMNPRNPWRLDAPLYFLGKSTCIKTRPSCGECRMRPACRFYRSRAQKV